ncbi:MAG: YdcF family protein [Rhizobiaceae bacterium]|nr:YdcF family protein [Rhizobiaceae bacterium]
MFFYLSKIFSLVIQPINLIGILVAAALVALLLGRRRFTTFSLAGGLLVVALSTWTSLGALMLHPLEDRFARPNPPPEQVAGIIVLGGGFEGAVNLARGGYELNASGDRFVEAAVLARRYPAARVVVTGGSGALALEGEADGDTAPRLLIGLGVEAERLVLENKSRNTYENALFTKEMLNPKPAETWLLVTSAFHMPRSMGLFRKAGFDVVAWPTDYRTAGNETVGLTQDNFTDSLQNTTIAIREWTGLIAYRVTGRTDALLPGPELPVR